METKKSLKADLEKGKTISLLMGLVVAMACLFVSFEWGTGDVKLLVSDRGDAGYEIEEILPVTRMETPPPPPPPPPASAADIIDIVDDTEDVANNANLTTEDVPNLAVPNYVPPSAPDEDEEEDENMEFILVEDMPEFPGGPTGLLNYINKAIRYPVIAQENGVQGRVVCSFIIDKTGKVVDAQVMRGIDPALDKEALRVVNTIPDWKPGRQRGKPVRVKYTVPITFRLQ